MLCLRLSLILILLVPLVSAIENNNIEDTLPSQGGMNNNNIKGFITSGGDLNNNLCAGFYCTEIAGGRQLVPTEVTTVTPVSPAVFSIFGFEITPKGGVFGLAILILVFFFIFFFLFKKDKKKKVKQKAKKIKEKLDDKVNNT